MCLSGTIRVLAVLKIELRLTDVSAGGTHPLPSFIILEKEVCCFLPRAYSTSRDGECSNPLCDPSGNLEVLNSCSILGAHVEII